MWWSEIRARKNQSGFYRERLMSPQYSLSQTDYTSISHSTHKIKTKTLHLAPPSPSSQFFLSGGKGSMQAPIPQSSQGPLPPHRLRLVWASSTERQHYRSGHHQHSDQHHPSGHHQRNDQHYRNGKHHQCCHQHRVSKDKCW